MITKQGRWKNKKVPHPYQDVENAVPPDFMPEGILSKGSSNTILFRVTSEQRQKLLFGKYVFAPAAQRRLHLAPDTDSHQTSAL